MSLLSDPAAVLAQWRTDAQRLLECAAPIGVIRADQVAGKRVCKCLARCSRANCRARRSATRSISS
jgi:hypothetical protein